MIEKIETEKEVIEREQIEAGKQLAEVFRLKRSKEFPDRYETDWGTKTALGVYLVAERIVKGE